MPPPYMWALFLHYQFLHMETSYMLEEKKCENPFFHQFTLYGLPSSKLPKVAYETGVGQDKPNDSRYQRPTPSLPVPPPRHTVNKFVIPTVMARRKLTSSTTSTSTIDHPTRPSEPTFTIYDIREACRRAERVSRGEQAGTSGSISVQDRYHAPIVSQILSLVNNLKQQGVVSETNASALKPATTSLPAPVTISDTASTTSTHEIAQGIRQLATAMAESVLPDDIPVDNSPADYVIEETPDLIDLTDSHGRDLLYQGMSDMESQHSINLDDVGGLLDSEEEQEEQMDQTEPTGTAAIPQNQVVFYNDPNFNQVQVQDQPQVDQQAAILHTVNTEEETNPETTSQNTTN